MDSPSTTPVPEKPKSRISRSLQARQILFILIAIGMTSAAIYDIYLGDLPWWLALAGALLGIVIGFFVGRLRAVRWHEDKQQIVTQLDVVGVAAIIAYIAFDSSRDWLFGHWFSGVTLSAFTLAVLAGLLIGRFLGVQRSIATVLREREALLNSPRNS